VIKSLSVGGIMAVIVSDFGVESNLHEG